MTDRTIREIARERGNKHGRNQAVLDFARKTWADVYPSNDRLQSTIYVQCSLAMEGVDLDTFSAVRLFERTYQRAWLKAFWNETVATYGALALQERQQLIESGVLEPDPDPDGPGAA